jgi:hypothetical protein
MTMKEVKAFKKENKLVMTKLEGGDNTIVSATTNRLEALINTSDPFPSDTNLRMLAEQANSWACRKYNRGNFSLIPGGEYEILVCVSRCNDQFANYNPF